jgi:hypothetical protein
MRYPSNLDAEEVTFYLGLAPWLPGFACGIWVAVDASSVAAAPSAAATDCLALKRGRGVAG